MFSDWSLLLYGTQDPAQPTDPKYDPARVVSDRPNSFSQRLSSITSQVGASPSSAPADAYLTDIVAYINKQYFNNNN